MKVVQFKRQLTARQQEVQDDIIKQLEDFLKRARAGQFIGVGLCAVNIDRTAFTTHSATDEFAALLGAMSRLEYRAHAESTGHEVDVPPMDDETPSPEKTE